MGRNVPSGEHELGTPVPLQDLHLVKPINYSNTDRGLSQDVLHLTEELVAFGIC